MTHQPITNGRAGETAKNLSPDAGFDLFRLDCLAGALSAGPPLTRAEQHDLARIIENLTALKETVQ